MFSGSDWDTKIARDIFLEASMPGLYSENVGVNPHLFADEVDFFSYLNETEIFMAER